MQAEREREKGVRGVEREGSQLVSNWILTSCQPQDKRMDTARGRGERQRKRDGMQGQRQTRQTETNTDSDADRDREWGGGEGGRGGGGGGEKGRRRRRKTQRHKSLFDWPVAFTKVILIVANCTLAKCSEEHKK